MFGPGGPLEGTKSVGSVKIPTLIHHNEARHVLLMRDLGPLPTLGDNLLALHHPAQVYTSNVIESAYHNVGTRLGTFLAELHAPATLAKVVHLAREMVNDGAKQAVCDVSSDPCRLLA